METHNESRADKFMEERELEALREAEIEKGRMGVCPAPARSPRNP